ncbi:MULTISPECIES: NADPH-dependent F420 reductase [unclassified Mesorhizobium]|uniref:NADPH-dependent F420 reductase n=1 Tax=unclassified Mesorhizobium TaxID=325217 RepID=UPI0003CF50DF|nr:NADPH-dependent F420 reductase [Mesorhizobium sp. LSHC420B00]ESX66267.1 NADP oxidoreductase [Mesorhizobium sp. LSHC420B00]
MNYAIVGSGAIGTALARRFVANGIDIAIANSKGLKSLAGLVSELGPIVKPVTASEALRADVVILAIPFDAVQDAVKDVEWDSRIVVDATNAIDFPAFSPRDLKGRLSTEIVADAVPGARVVKAFNTLPAAILGADPAVLGGRRVLFVSGDDPSARLAVVDLVERLGFAAVDLGGIAEGGRAQQFGGGVSGQEFVQLG